MSWYSRVSTFALLMKATNSENDLRSTAFFASLSPAALKTLIIDRMSTSLGAGGVRPCCCRWPKRAGAALDACPAVSAPHAARGATAARAAGSAREWGGGLT